MTIKYDTSNFSDKDYRRYHLKQFLRKAVYRAQEVNSESMNSSEPINIQDTLRLSYANNKVVPVVLSKDEDDIFYEISFGHNNRYVYMYFTKENFEKLIVEYGLKPITKEE